MLKLFYKLVIFFGLSFLYSCGSDHSKIKTHTTKDDYGREIVLPVKIERIYSLSPSITEFIYKLHLENKLVARSPHCNFPKEVLKKKVIQSYPPDIEKIIKNKVQVVFALKGFISEENIEKLHQFGIETYLLKFETVQETIDAVVKLGKILDDDYHAEMIRDTLNMELHTLKNFYSLNEQSPKVLVMISPVSMYAFGNKSYITNLLHLSGFQNYLPEDLENPFPVLKAEALIKNQPDVIIYLKNQSGKEHGLNYYHPELSQLKAIKENKEFFIDEDLLSRPSPRINITLKKIIEIHDQILAK